MLARFIVVVTVIINIAGRKPGADDLSSRGNTFWELGSKTSRLENS